MTATNPEASTRRTAWRSAPGPPLGEQGLDAADGVSDLVVDDHLAAESGGHLRLLIGAGNTLLHALLGITATSESGTLLLPRAVSYTHLTLPTIYSV